MDAGKTPQFSSEMRSVTRLNAERRGGLNAERKFDSLFHISAIAPSGRVGAGRATLMAADVGFVSLTLLLGAFGFPSREVRLCPMHQRQFPKVWGQTERFAV